MMDEKKLFDAMTDINESYIQDAKNFRERNVVRGHFVAKSVAAAAIAVLLMGTTVYGASIFVRQLHMNAYRNEEDMMREQNIKPWESNIGYLDADFNENVFSDLTPESLVDILTNNDSEQKYNMEQGKLTDKWKRKISSIQEESGEDEYYEAYEYEHLSDALLNWNINLDVSYIEQNYSHLAGEYGCDFLYADEGKKECIQSRFFSGFRDANENFVSVEYSSDANRTNKNLYELYKGEIGIYYYTTKDGVEVYLTTRKGKSGKTYTLASVYTEHNSLYIGMYGDFSNNEVKQILNSLNIAKGMNIDVSK